MTAALGLNLPVVPLLRLLLPIVAALTLLGTSVTSWAAVGLIGDVKCCCPAPSKCKCRDHDGKPRPSEIRPCGSGVVQLVTPTVAAAIHAAAPVVTAVPAVSDVLYPASVGMPDFLPVEPETPPF